MTFLETKIPPPIVGLLSAGLSWLLSIIGPEFYLDSSLKLGLVVLLVIVGFGIPITASLSFKKAKTTINPLNPEQASCLVNTGVFSLTRNPMYLGMALLLVAWAIYLLSYASLACVILFVLYIDRFQIQPEERALNGIFGEEFTQYKNAVRRWI